MENFISINTLKNSLNKKRQTLINILGELNIQIIDNKGLLGIDTTDIEKLYTYIEYYSKKISLSQLAKDIGVSREYIKKICEKLNIDIETEIKGKLTRVYINKVDIPKIKDYIDQGLDVSNYLGMEVIKKELDKDFSTVKRGFTYLNIGGTKDNKTGYIYYTNEEKEKLKEYFNLNRDIESLISRVDIKKQYKCSMNRICNIMKLLDIKGSKTTNGIFYTIEDFNKFKDNYERLTKGESVKLTNRKKLPESNMKTIDEVLEILNVKTQPTLKRYFEYLGIKGFPLGRKTYYTLSEIDKLKDFLDNNPDSQSIMMKQTCQERYGVDYYILSPLSNKRFYLDGILFDSSWEVYYYIWLRDNNYDFIVHPKTSFSYKVNNSIKDYYPDFLVGSEYVEIKGGQFFDKNGNFINPYDRSLDDTYQKKYECMVQNNVKIIGEKDIKGYKTYYENNYGDINKYNIVQFPFPSFNNTELLLDLDSITKSETIKNIKGLKVINHFHKSIFTSNINGYKSPCEGWQDERIMEKCKSNRLKYKGKINDDILRQGLNISKLAPKVSVFRPSVARYIINKYAKDSQIIVDPFSGFSGRMLGVNSLGKIYIGSDISKSAIVEGNNIIEYFGLKNCTLTQQDILLIKDNNKYDCLLTCPPYNIKENWNNNKQENFSCDEWIDICLDKLDCKKYIFVVDKTEKYSKYIVETLVNQSHFNKNEEKILYIEK